MRRARREVWVERIQRWIDSGLTAKEYAAQTGFNANTLTNWKWRLGGAIQERVQRSPPVVEVKLAPPAAAPGLEQEQRFEVVLASGAMVRVPTRFDGGALRALVAALEAR
jgi:hypothetical protein